MKRLPLISIIIATKDAETTIERLLLSITKQSYKQKEIILIDNYSKDTTVQIARKFTTKIYLSGNERSEQRNFGARKAKGSYLLFLDADMSLPPSFLKLTASQLQNTRTQAFIVPEQVPKVNFFSQVKSLEKELYKGESLIEAPRLFTPELFQRVGGYTENLVAGEDWDIAQKTSKIATIGRINGYLLHYETSLKRELVHKWYYAKNIRKYKKTQAQQFRKQSGKERIYLFYRKRNLLYQNIFLTFLLLVLKTIEYGIYLLRIFI